MTSAMDDWAAKAAEQIEITKNKRARTVLRIATIIREHAEPLVALLRESKREHQEEHYDIYACEKLLDRRRKCTCGADTWNTRVDLALAGSIFEVRCRSCGAWPKDGPMFTSHLSMSGFICTRCEESGATPEIRNPERPRFARERRSEGG